MPSGFSPDDYLGGSRGPTPASYSPSPNIGFQIGDRLAGLPAQQEAGAQRGVAQALRTAFPDGLPMRPDGSVDALGIVNKVAGIQGMDAGSIQPLLNLAARQSLSVGDQPPGATAAAPQAPPAPPTARSMLGLSAPVASNDQSGDVNTVRGVATEVFGDTDVSHLLPRYSAALKVADADAPLSQDQITVARRLMGKSAAALRAQPSQSPVSSDEGVSQRPGSTFSQDYAYNGGAGVPTGSGASGSPGPSASGAGPSSAPLMAGARAPQGPQAGQPGTQPAAPAAGGGTRMAQAATAPNGSVGQPGRDPAAGLVPAGLNMSSLQYATWLQHRAMAHSQAGDKEGADLFQKAAQPILDALKQSGELTETQKLARDAGVTPQQYATEQETYKKYGEAKGKRIGEVVEAGGLPARQTVRTLNTMEEALTRGGSNISTGPGAEQWLKVKQGANNLFPGLFQGVPESETVQKLNAQLAAEAAKAMTARPSQLEFRAFMQNNPGLTTSVAGSKVLISVLRQAKEQDIALSRMAMNQDNLRNWTDVEDRFYAEHPIVGPWSQTATNSKTGEQLVLSGGKWIKVPK